MGQKKAQARHTQIPRIFIHVVCRFNSIAFAMKVSGGEGALSLCMAGRIRMTIDPRTPTKPGGRRTSGFHQPGRGGRKTPATVACPEGRC